MSRAVGDWVNGFLNYTNENNEAPSLFREWVAISVLAGVLQRKCYLEWGPLVFYPNMYIILVGPSGKTRKGTAMTPGMQFLRKMGVKLAAESITREALVRELRKSNSTIGSNEESVQIVTHSSLTIYSQELTVFLGYNNQTLLSDLTDWYDCRNEWTYRTKNKGTDEIKNVFVNLIGATTPELLQTALPRDAIGGGLTSRMIFVYQNKKGKVIPTPFLSKQDKILGDQLTTDLSSILAMQGNFKFTQKFIDRWVDWYVDQETNKPFEDERFSGYIERRPNHALKLCIILSASQSSSMLITESILNRALDLLNRTEKSMLYAFRGVGESSFASIQDRIMSYVGANRNKEITYPEILKRFYYDIDEDGLNKILATLHSIGFLELSKKLTTRNGSRSHVVTVRYLEE